MRPGVGADGVALGVDAFENFGMPARVFPDREESRLDALSGECREHGRSIARPRAVVERQHDLPRFQEIMRLEMLEAESGSAGGIYLHDARQTKRVRIARAG